jgi:putative ABC transport system ATP-binding protein
VALFREFAREHGTTILIVTHDEKILDSADRIVNMRQGRIISDVDVGESIDLCAYLKACPPFASLTADTLAQVADKMVLESFSPAQEVVVQGEEGDKFYVIKSGTADVFLDDGTTTRQVRTLRAGDSFGEAALLLDQPRSATVVARDALEVYVLGKDDFRVAVGSVPTFQQQVRRSYFLRQ